MSARRNKGTVVPLRDELTPLAHMLAIMRSPLAPELAERIRQVNDGTCELDPDLVRQLREWHTLRFEAAKAAAPYVHPRLSALTNPQVDGPQEIIVRHFHEQVADQSPKSKAQGSFAGE